MGNLRRYFHISSKWSLNFLIFVLFISFLVFGHCWQQSYENTKMLHNLCLHFVRQNVQDRKKRKGNHATKVTKIPKTKRRKYGMKEPLMGKVGGRWFRSYFWRLEKNEKTLSDIPTFKYKERKKSLRMISMWYCCFFWIHQHDVFLLLCLSNKVSKKMKMKRKYREKKTCSAAKTKQKHTRR